MLDNWFFDNLFNWLGLFGLAGQATFMMRFLVQWVASEKRKRSYVPIAFWYLSVVGGLMLFLYALMNHDPVIMLGQALGIVIYVRNLILIHGRRYRFRMRREADSDATAETELS